MKVLRLGLGVFDEGGPPPPENIAWAGTHEIEENSALGTVVGGDLSAIDLSGLAVTFSLVDDDNGNYGIGPDGTSIIVTGIPDFETDPAPTITVRATNSGGSFSDLVFVITVLDVDEAAPEDPLPPGTGVDDGTFTDPIVAVDVDGSTKLKGKKDAGSLGKFLYDLGAPISGVTYTMEYDPDFTLLTNTGEDAMVGFVAKAGNDFFIVGLKGDGAGGLDAYMISGDGLWTSGVGLTESDEGVADNGTQAGPNFLQVTFNANNTVTVRTSADGVTWDVEFTTANLGPFANIAAITQFGPGALFPPTDTGPFTIDIHLWASDFADLTTATAAFSASRLLVQGYAGDLLTINTARVETFHDQSGNTRDLTQGTAANRPVEGTAGANGRACVTFTGSAIEFLASAVAMSNFFSGSTSYMVISFICTSITSNGAGVLDHHVVGANTTGGQQLLIQGQDTSGHLIKVHNFDGTADILPHGMTRDEAHVVEVKHESGVVSMRLDRSDWVTMASGTSTLTAVLRMGSGAGGTAGNSFTGHIFEFATYSTVPSQTFQNQLSRNFADWVGGVPLGKTYNQPLFSNVKLLLSGDGVDGSTTFTDESNVGRTMTAVGNAQVDTSTFQFGTGSMQFDGSGDQITAADSDDWHFPGEFAIEFFIRPNTADGSDNVITQWTNINGGCNFTMNYSFTSATVKSMSFSMSPDANTGNLKGLGVSSHNIDQSVFHHVLIERDDTDTLRMFFDGVCHRSNKLTGGGNAATSLRLGGRNDLGGNLNAWLDEVRIVKGQHICGTDAGFDVPTAAHPRS